MSGRLSGKGVVVVGGAHGIGRACAEHCAAERAAVAILDRDELDVSDERGVQRTLRAAAADLPALDVVVNAAGISLGGTAVETSRERWARVLDVNLTGAFYICREAIAIMRAARTGGAIVTIASIQATAGFRGFAAYASSKAGLVGLTRQLALDYVADGVRVNCVSPGAIDVPDKGARVALDEPDYAAVGDETAAAFAREPVHVDEPLRRSGTPDDVARAVVFLASDDAAFITGQDIVVDGGYGLWLG